MTNEYPDQRPFHPAGHSGTEVSCEWTAMICVGTSQTAHLEMYGRIAVPVTYNNHVILLHLLSITHWIHHWRHRLFSTEPEGIVVSGRHVTDGVDVTEHEWHGVESGQT